MPAGCTRFHWFRAGGRAACKRSLLLGPAPVVAAPLDEDLDPRCARIVAAGFADTSTYDLAAGAGVSRATAWRHARRAV
jgi:hypothetical protein